MSERISRLRVPEDEEVPPEVKAIWAEPLAKLGFVPNVLRIWALRPSHLVGWWSHYDELLRGDSGLTKAQREMIAVAVSTANGCHYCMTSHGAALRVLSGRPELSDLIVAGDHSSLEPREQAMLSYAVKVTLDHGSCTGADLDALRAHGWTDQDVFDITETAAMFNMTNRLANALGWDPNPEYEALGR